MKSTWFGAPARYEFAKCINSADYGIQGYDLFRKFLICAHATIQQSANKLSGTFDDEIESAYAREMNSLKYPTKFPEAFGLLVMALEEEAYDFLGYTFMELGVANKFAGQCFTPRDVSKAMAGMLLNDLQPIDGQTLTLAEPACGGGSMVIEASNILKDLGFYPWHYHWWATDVDWKCYAMTLIQTTLLGIPAVVTCGNSLTLEVFTKSANLISLIHPPKKKETHNDANQQRTKKESPQDETHQPRTQLNLFS